MILRRNYWKERALRSESDVLTIDLMGRGNWEPVLERALNTADQRVRYVTATLLTTFHDRHVGLTPELAVGFAHLLVVPGAQRLPRPPWGAVISRLRRTLGIQQATDPRNEHSEGFLLRESPSYSMLHLALPLVTHACRRIGRSVLFCADDLPGGVTDANYKRYADELTLAMRELAESDTRATAAGALPDDDVSFWAEIALTLTSRSQVPNADGLAAPLAQVDPLMLAWLMRLRPDPAPRLITNAPPRVMLTPLKRQKSRRLREGGVTGYRLTRRIEDFDEIVMSELLNPPPLLLDRLLNSGYQVVERPPRHQKRRDILVVGMLPPSVYRLPIAGFLKACWFECMWRFGSFLRMHDLTRSEMRWIESDGDDRARSASYLLQDLPGLLSDDTANEGDRWMFLKTLRWIPSFLNQHDRAVALKPIPERQADNQPAEQSWLRAAWDVQRDTQRLDTHDKLPSRLRPWPEVVAEFAHLHLMLFLPAALLDSHPDERRVTAIRLQKRMLARFRLSSSAGAHLSITFVPEQVSSVDSWLVVTSAGVGALDTTDTSPEAVAGRLQQLWLNYLIKDMCRA